MRSESVGSGSTTERFSLIICIQQPKHHSFRRAADRGEDKTLQVGRPIDCCGTKAETCEGGPAGHNVNMKPATYDMCLHSLLRQEST